MGKQKGLEIIGLLDETYHTLIKKHGAEILKFERHALSEIANDSDYHRTRIGYMGYEGVGLFSLEGRKWAVGRGIKTGAYPGRRYVGDIIALDSVLDENTEERISLDHVEPHELEEKLIRGIRASFYFSNTLFSGVDDGCLSVREVGAWGIPTRFGSKMRGLLDTRISGFILQAPEYAEGLISASTLGPIATKGFLYKPETAKFLVGVIEQVLKEASPFQGA